MDKRQIALVGLIVASFIWGTNGVVTKLLIKVYGPIPLGFLRFFVASLLVFPWVIKHWKKTYQKNFLPLLLTSVFLTGNIYLFFRGMQTTTANAAVVIYAGGPVMVAIFSYLFIKEHMTPQKMAGICIALIGILAITFLPILNGGTIEMGDLGGNILVISALFCWSAYTIYSRHLMNTKGLEPFTITAFSFCALAIFFGILTAIFPQRPLLAPLYNIQTLLLILYIGSAVTVVTYFLYQQAIKHTSATTASLTGYIQPVFGILMNVIFLGEIITSGFVLGSILVFIGVFLTTNPTQHARNWLRSRRNRSK